MAAATSLQAVELKAIVGGSMTASINAIAPQFEKATGHTLVSHFDSTPNIIARVNSGTPFDVVVVPVDVFKDASAKARFAPGPTVDIARVGYGVIVRAGAPKPDISTPDAFKSALLAAPSVAFLPASAAGAYVTRVFDRLGIAEEMKAKTKVQTAPAQIAPAVARGDAELGVFLTNVLIAPGVELAGRDVRVLIEAWKRRPIPTGDPQETIAKDALRVGEVAQHLLDAPLARRVPCQRCLVID
jgi:molybdate transport system substrate-binding protein